MDWQQLFQSHILDRGFQYYRQGLVEDFCKGEDCIEATVQGSEEYNVFIDIEEEEVVDMDCDCPYAAEGNYCKHMAAVMFYAEADQAGSDKQDGNDTELYSQTVSSGDEEVKVLVQNADEIFVRNFLTGILMNDGKLLNRFKSAICCKISPSDMKRYKKQIDGIFRYHAGRHGFIDYYNAGPFIAELEDFLEHDIQGLLDNREYEEAFELTNYIFVNAGNQDMDDSDGGTGMLADRCLEIWQEILESCDMELKRKMFQWYIDHLDGSVIDYMEEYIEQILFEDFMEEEFLAHKFRFTEKKVCAYKKEKDSWGRGYYAGMWVLKHIGVMKDQKVSQELIDEYCKENLEFNSVREYYVKNLIDKGSFDTAIRVLEEGKIVDKSLFGLVAGYSVQLQDLYQRTGNIQAYKKELWSYVLEYSAGDVAAYKELKSLYTEAEWEEKREVIFKALSPHTRVDKLYAIEGLYDRLLRVVLESGLSMLTEYEKCLKPIYPTELLARYEVIVKNMATRVSDRKHYQEIVALLRRMQRYPEGAAKVKEIVTSFRLAYKNRPAMMDELRKL